MFLPFHLRDNGCVLTFLNSNVPIKFHSNLLWEKGCRKLQSSNIVGTEKSGRTIFVSWVKELVEIFLTKNFRFLMAGVAGKNGNKLFKDDIIYATLPLYHTSSGIVGVSQTLVNGSTLALRDKFSASNFWKDCIKYNVTVSKAPFFLSSETDETI